MRNKALKTAAKHMLFRWTTDDGQDHEAPVFPNRDGSYSISLPPNQSGIMYCGWVRPE